jgi:hypothetical protein
MHENKQKDEYLCYWQRDKVGAGIRGALEFDMIDVKRLTHKDRVFIPSHMAGYSSENVLVVKQKKVVVNEDGSVTITAADGTETEVPATPNEDDESTTATLKNGSTITVSKNGKITTTAADGTVTTTSSYSKWIEFFSVTEWILLFQHEVEMKAFEEAFTDVEKRNELFKDTYEIDFEGALSANSRDTNGRQSSVKFTEASPFETGKAIDAARKLGKHLKITKREEGEILYILDGPDSLERIRREWTESCDAYLIYCNETRKAAEEDLAKQSLGFKVTEEQNTEEWNAKVTKLQDKKWKELLEDAKRPFEEKAARALCGAAGTFLEKKQQVCKFVKYILDEGAVEQQDPSSNDQAGSTQTRDKGHAGFKLKDFLKLSVQDKNDRFELEGHENSALHKAINAADVELEEKHIAALRIYTSPLYRHINYSLRNPRHKSPYPATILLLDEALKLLRQVHAGDGAQKRAEYWRGMKNLTIPPEFKQCGGTEYACLSTSPDKATIAEYAKSPTPLIFRVVATSFASRAADISWVSLYPGENERLFPPLTYLKYIRELKITDCPEGTVVEVEAVVL